MLSLCMIVKDEQNVLDRCLGSVRGLADEIVVVDTGSTDRTVEIARDHGATVLHHDFADVDFAAARNRGLAAATGDFALVLDADEVLREHGADLVRGLVDAGRPDTGFVVTRVNHGAGVDHAVRLFPLRPEFRYRNRVHETIDAAILEAGGRLVRSPIVIDHHLPPAPRQAEKGRFYLRLLRRDLADDPDNVDRLTFLAAEHHKLGEFDEATRVAERIASLVPDDADAHLTVALYHHAYGGDPERARVSVRRALRLRPQDPDAYALWTALEAA